MTTHAHRRTELARLAIAGAFLLAGLAGMGQAASAGSPLVDDGGSGSGSTAAASQLEEPTLVGSGPEREIVVDTESVPTLVGSGPDREIVAESDSLPTIVGASPDLILAMNTDSQQSAGALDETARANDLIAMSSGTVAAGTLDETTRSSELIALSHTDTFDTTAARRGQPY